MRPITASDLMNPEVLAVRDNMTLPELASFLTENEFSGAPVRDRDGNLVGVVSMADLTRALAESPAASAETRVADVMTPKVYTIAADASVSEVASAMLDNHLHRLLVTGSDGEPVGIVSTSDLLGLMIDEDD